MIEIKRDVVMTKINKNSNGNIQGSFEKDGKRYHFSTNASFHKSNNSLVKQFINENIVSSSSEHLIKELTRCDDRLLAYY